MESFMTSLIFVVLAEMGDKTQLLGMCFAARYHWRTVLWGVFVATVFNHYLAVVAGVWLTRFVSMETIQIVAAISFILFGLWTIRGDELDDECTSTRFSPFWTVTIAFFIAEMGDKTQLATVALAARFNEVIPVWMGTTLGMMIANAFGIVVGVTLGKKIPERLIKWFAASIFIIFGLITLYQSVPAEFLRLPYIGGVIGLTVVAMYAVARYDKK